MRLKTLDIRGFGQLRGIVDLETGPGSIALLLESNEAGKSTLAAAITAGLYGLDSNRTRYRNRMTPVERFRPWGGGSYGLELLLDRGGHELRIMRDFDRGQVEVLDGARDITSEFQRGKSVEVGEILTGLTEAQFALSAFVPQGAIVWDDPSALAEALQRAADSQAGDNTAASAIDVLQSALDQYEGIELKKGRARTEVQRCREEAAKAEAALDDLERRREALDEEIDQLRSLETAEDQSRIRRGAIRLRRSMTELEFESAALASDSERIARSRELEALLDEDPALELITDEVRRAVESARRDHGILLVKYQKAAVDLSNAGELRDEGREQLQKESLTGTPTRAQVSELGAWCHAHADIARRRSQLQGSLEHERVQLRRAGFDPATATRLGERFSGLIEADRAILGSLRKRRMEIEDESERLSTRLAEARGELESIARDQDRRRRRGFVIAITGLVVAAAGAMATRFMDVPLWAGPIPGALLLAGGIFLAGSASAHRRREETVARTRVEDQGEQFRRLDETRKTLAGQLDQLAARLDCSAAELEESWQSWLDLQPHVSGLSVHEERLDRIDEEEQQLTEAVGSLQTLVGHVPGLDEIGSLYETFRRVRELADRVEGAEASRAEHDSRRIQKETELVASRTALRQRLGALGVELDDHEDLDAGFSRFEERATSALKMAQIRDSELPQLIRLIASPQQRATREERVNDLGVLVSTARPGIERELESMGAEGRELLATLDEPLTEGALQGELRALEADTERRHARSTRQHTEVRSFIQLYEGQAPLLRDRIEELVDSARRAEEFADAVQLARDTLDTLAQQTHEVWSRELAVHTNRIVQAMGSDIGQVEFDEDLNLALVQRGQRMSGSEARQALSTGARDLLHLACRLALAHFLSGGGLDLPLILDDPFAHCDDPRTIKGMNVLLDSIAPDHQVILLACQRSRYDWLRQQLRAPDRIRMLALEDRV
jgi:DNA repair exonuclease SbcCD ATPase subunit